MTATQTFEVVGIGALLVQTVLPIALLIGLPWPRSRFPRAITVILVAWITYFFYTDLVYNPSGIASGIEQGLDSPEMKFDNNATAIALLLGWFYPMVSLCVFLLGRRIWQRHRSVPAENSAP